MKDYSWVTNEMFAAKLEELLDNMSGAQLLALPGVYEAVCEHLNNDVLDALADDRESWEVVEEKIRAAARSKRLGIPGDE